MPQWNRTIKLADLVARWKSGELTIPQLAEKVVERIEASGWVEDTAYPDTLRDHLGRLKQAEYPSAYEASFEYVYDVADQDRVWIETS
jgi:hypothetical protein